MNGLERRLTAVNRLLAGAMALVLFWLACRMIARGAEIQATPFRDAPFQARLERLVADGIVAAGRGGLTVDEPRLAEVVPDEGARSRVRAALAGLEVVDGRILPDPDWTKVTNPRFERDEARVHRGRILDRHGVALAETVVDRATGRRRRVHRDGAAFFPLLGTYQPAFGKLGLERALDPVLRGTAEKSWWRTLADLLRPERSGDDVVLTLDARAQRLAHAELAGRRGAVVALDVATGAVLVAASSPSLDPDAVDARAWRAAERDAERRPFLNRAFAESYFPGSTFKVVVASAWFDRHARAGYEVDCNGFNARHRIREHGSPPEAHGRTGFARAMALSCNVFFSTLAAEIGPALRATAERMGFNRRFALAPDPAGDALESAPSRALAVWERAVPPADGEEQASETPPGAGDAPGSARWAIRSFDDTWLRRNPGLVAQVGIGQNLVSATPLQMAVVASIIAARGELREPYLVAEYRPGITFAGGRPAPRPVQLAPRAARRVLEARAAARVGELMEEVMKSGTGAGLDRLVRGEAGYAVEARGAVRGAREVRVAGKTGTAEVVGREAGAGSPRKPPHSWFICFAPADAPKVAVAAIVENGGYGSRVAAPLAMKVLAEALNGLEEPGLR